jgi:GMP synthase-like glutamine amidotransferase
MQTKLRINCIQHVPFEGPGIIEEWAKENGHSLSLTRLYYDEKPPSVDRIDWLIIMGGPMSFDDYEKYPWLRHETDYITKAIGSKKTIIGICLGAQLIAEAMGGYAKHAITKEIGWYPIEINKKTKHNYDLDFLNDVETVFHWHSDTFDLPDGAVQLASSEATKNQGFIYRKRVYGLQFHLEMRASDVEEMLTNCAEDITGGIFVQSPDKIRKGINKHCKRNNHIMKKFLDCLS